MPESGPVKAFPWEVGTKKERAVSLDKNTEEMDEVNKLSFFLVRVLACLPEPDPSFDN